MSVDSSGFLEKPVKFLGATLWRIWRSVSRSGSACLQKCTCKVFPRTLAIYLRETSRNMTMSGDFATAHYYHKQENIQLMMLVRVSSKEQ